MIEFSDRLGTEGPARPIPKGILAAMGSMALVAVVLTLVSTSTGIGRVPVEVAADPSVEALTISFIETSDGGIEVVRTSDDALLTRLEAGEGGFMRGILRPLKRERERFDLAPGDPYVLTRHASGAVTLSDASTDLVVDIAAFGSTSVGYFAALFTAGDDLP